MRDVPAAYDPEPTTTPRRRATPPRRPTRRYDGPTRFGYAREEPSRLEALEAEVEYLRALIAWLHPEIEL